MAVLNCRSRISAFSFLELIVAIAVFSAGITVILQANSFCARVTGLSGDIIKAAFLSEDKLQEFEFQEKNGLSREGLLTTQGKSGKFDWKANLEPDSDSGLKKLNFEVKWKRTGRQERISCLTFLR